MRTLLYYIIYRCKDFLLFAFIDIFARFVFIFSLFIYFICEKQKNALTLHQNSIKIQLLIIKIIIIMKSLVWVVLQSVIVDGKESKSIHNVYLFKSQAQDRMNEIVVEFEDKQDDHGDYLWDCERPWWNVANFKSNTHNYSMRIEVIEREIEI